MVASGGSRRLMTAKSASGLIMVLAIFVCREQERWYGIVAMAGSTDSQLRRCREKNEVRHSGGAAKDHVRHCNDYQGTEARETGVTRS